MKGICRTAPQHQGQGSGIWGQLGGHMAMAEPVSDLGSHGHTSALAISDEG